MLRQGTERLGKGKKQEGVWNKNLCAEDLRQSVRISQVVVYRLKASCLISLQAYQGISPHNSLIAMSMLVANYIC